MHNQWIFYCHLKHCWRHVLCLLCDLGTLRSFRAMAIPVVVGLCLNFAIVGHLAETWPREDFRHFLKNRAFQQNILGYSTNNHMKK